MHVIPHIPGQSDFRGHILHMHDYRDPAEFEGMVVFYLGGGMSGQDIALDLLPHAKRSVLVGRCSPNTRHKCWPSNADSGPALRLHRANVSSLPE